MIAWYCAAFLAFVTAVVWLGVWWTLRTFPVPPLMDQFPLTTRYRPDPSHYLGAMYATACFTTPIVHVRREWQSPYDHDEL